MSRTVLDVLSSGGALTRSDDRLQRALEAGKPGAWEFGLQTGALTSSARCKANHSDGIGTGSELALRLPCASRL